MNKKKKGNVVAKVGVSLALAAATAAGVYFFGKKGEANRKKAKTWVADIQKDVVVRLKKAGQVNREAYENIVSGAAERYASLREIAPEEISEAVKELKGHWQNIRKHLGEEKKTVSKKSTSTRKKKGA